MDGYERTTNAGHSISSARPSLVDQDGLNFYSSFGLYVSVQCILFGGDLDSEIVFRQAL